MTPEEILKNKNIKYTTSGADLVVHCLNPEHEDNNPSMRIDRISGKYNCFSCGYSGSIYKLFNIHRNLLDVRVLNLKEKIRRINKPKLQMPLGAEYFCESYRDITVSTYNKFNAFTLPGDKEWDGRLVFPITDISNEIICFHGRYLYSKTSPKYMTKPEKTRLPLFPAMPEIIAGSIILVEGLFDMLNLYDKGLTNAVCCFGTQLTSKSDKNNFKLKNRFSHYKMQGVSSIYIMFDGDAAGNIGANKLYNALKDNYIVETLTLEEGTDPGSLSIDDVNKIKEYLYERSNS